MIANRLFEAALRDLPLAVFGSYDALYHKTVSDLVWIAQHELDLYEEGEETDIRSKAQVAQVRKFIAKWKHGTR